MRLTHGSTISEQWMDYVYSGISINRLAEQGSSNTCELLYDIGESALLAPSFFTVSQQNREVHRPRASLV
jgi:hypothetical protein